MYGMGAVATFAMLVVMSSPAGAVATARVLCSST